MPSIPHIARIRKRRVKKYTNSSTFRIGFGFALLLSLAVIIVSFSSLILYSFATRNLPSLDILPFLLEPPNGVLLQPTRFYDRSGKKLIHTVENPAVVQRNYYSIRSNKNTSEQDTYFPSTLLRATIAVSDPTFLTNPGFTFDGIRDNSHNTIAQRLVSNLLLLEEPPSFWRSIRERILAAQITNHYGRNKVLEWYLNAANYGNLAYGADAAAQVYFGKNAEKLNLMEAAILAGVSESPALNPLDSPQTAFERGKIVIEALAGQNLISSAEALEANNSEIIFMKPVIQKENLSPSFVHLAWESLSQYIPNERIELGGFDVITTLNYDLQIQAACTTKIHLSQKLNGENQSSTIDGFECEAAQLLPTVSLNENSSLLDNMAANLVILDTQTGEILAVVNEPSTGSIGSIKTIHPSGSLLTPFVYLTAFTRGFGPASLVWDIPLKNSGSSDLEVGQIDNFVGPVRLRYALANDYLSPAMQLINQIGGINILKTASQLGLTSLSLPNPENDLLDCQECQMILDGGEVSILEAVQAFSVFANQGILIGQSPDLGANLDTQPLNPISILEINDHSNLYKIVLSETEKRPVISNQLAYLMTHILSDEAARWPSLKHPNPLEIGRPAGAKIGGTQKGNDVWTVGFTPELVVGIWLGVSEFDSGEMIPPKIASSLWHAVIQYAAQVYPPEGWSKPPGITSMNVCNPSGMLPTLQCPSIVHEVFLEGQEPILPDTLYQTYQVNRETGRLATVFTPPDLIEDRIYFNIPPMAISWAENTGLETPPDTFDQIYTPSMDPDVRINSPEMHDQLKGVIRIEGQASGDNFESYWLQVGEGINPTGWTVIKEESHTPVEKGILTTWDTSEYSGLYAIQLIVLRDNQQVDTATIQVSLDNTPPTLEISYPEDGSVFNSDENQSITLLVEVLDNDSLEKVEYYIDKKLVTTQTTPPFAFPWRTRIGTHIITVVATDFAGNQGEDSITLIIK